MNWLAIVSLFLSVVLGGSLVFFFNPRERQIRILLGFSGAFLLALAFTKIIPSIFSQANSFYLGYFVLAGFFIQLIIEYFAKGVAHGHNHQKESHRHAINPFALFIGISLHAFFEGMPFSGHFTGHEPIQQSLLAGILIHKIPIAIVLTSMFIQAGYSRGRTFAQITLFALMAPLGAVASSFSEVFFKNSQQYYGVIMALVVGIFLHIATVILFENDKDHKFNLAKFITIIIGVLVAIGVSSMGH